MLMTASAVSYSIAALAFLCLTILLLTTWRGGRRGSTVTLACLLSAVWAASVAIQVSWGAGPMRVPMVFEVLRNGAWSVFLLTLLESIRPSEAGSSSGFRRSTVVIAAVYLILLLALLTDIWSPGWSDNVAVTLRQLVQWLVMSQWLIMSIIGMFLVEQLYRITPHKQRWGIKLGCVGIGALFAYDFYLYSDALLFKQVNMDIWAARGVVNALSVPLIAVSAARNPKWSLGIAVSRRIVLHSAALFGSSIYLLAMSAAGYYLRFFGGSWGTMMQVAFLFGALVLLVTMLFSGSMRSWLKVFINKHFYNYRYDYREEWMRFTRRLAGSGPGLGERTIQSFAELVESPAGALYLCRESSRCEPVAQWNIPATGNGEPVDSEFYRFLETRQWVIDLRELELVPERYAGLTLPSWLQAIPKAWLVVPLILQNRVFGFVVLCEPRSRFNLNWEVIDLLKIAGSQAASYLSAQESANALMTARQFESFNRMSAFIVHDLKNVVSQLSLLLSNAKHHQENPEFRADMLDTVDASVTKMKTLLQKLRHGSATERPAPVCLDKLLQHVVTLKSKATPAPLLDASEPNLHVLANWERLERVLGNIIQNAIEATTADGSVTVRLGRHDCSAVIDIVDTGHGMSEEFIRERLFQPFVSTKSAGMGIGMFESRAYVNELGGQIDVISRQAVGTTFRVTLPLRAPAARAVLSAA